MNSRNGRIGVTPTRMMVGMAVATSHDPSSRGKPSGVLRIGVTVGTLGLHRKSCSRAEGGGKGCKQTPKP